MTNEELLALAAAASPRPYVAELDDFGNGEHEAIVSNAKTDILFTAGTGIGYAAPADGSWTPADEEAKNETWRRARETQAMRDAAFLAAAANEVERLIHEISDLRRLSAARGAMVEDLNRDFQVLMKERDALCAADAAREK